MLSVRGVRCPQVLRGENWNRNPDAGNCRWAYDLVAYRSDHYNSRVLQGQGGPPCVPVGRARLGVESGTHPSTMSRVHPLQEIGPFCVGPTPTRSARAPA